MNLLTFDPSGYFFASSVSRKQSLIKICVEISHDTTQSMRSASKSNTDCVDRTQLYNWSLTVLWKSFQLILCFMTHIESF